MLKRAALITIPVLILCGLSACSTDAPAPAEPADQAPPADTPRPEPTDPAPREQADAAPEPAPAGEVVAVMATSKGPIRLRLFADKTPLTCANFVNLVRRGYYDGLTFHRVIADFMIQGGCPLGTGSGDPGYRFEDETLRDLRHSKPGILSMANAGPATNGSQFFITHKATPWLDGKHTVFGEVIDQDDQDVVNSIVKGDTIESVEIQGDVSALMARMKTRVDQWNKALDQKFTNLRPAE